MTTEQENALLPLALTAAIKASHAIMDIYDSGADIGIVEKEDHTPVTRADMKSNGIIADALAPSGLPILSEETAHEAYAVRRDHPLMWVVDPLDGTKEFIKRNGMFSVCIAVVEDHRPVLGVIAIPVDGVVYFTRGGSAWRAKVKDEDSLGAETRLPVHFGPLPHVVLGSVSHPGEATNRVVEALRSVSGWADVSLVGVGSSIKQCMIAEGVAAFYPRSGTTMEWDTAAGQAIIEAAGGRLVTASDGQPMGYNRPELRNPDFVAVAGGVGDDVLSVALKALNDNCN